MRKLKIELIYRYHASVLLSNFETIPSGVLEGCRMVLHWIDEACGLLQEESWANYIGLGLGSSKIFR